MRYLVFDSCTSQIREYAITYGKNNILEKRFLWVWEYAPASTVKLSVNYRISRFSTQTLIEFENANAIVSPNRIEHVRIGWKLIWKIFKCLVIDRHCETRSSSCEQDSETEWISWLTRITRPILNDRQTKKLNKTKNEMKNSDTQHAYLPIKNKPHGTLSTTARTNVLLKHIIKA